MVRTTSNKNTSKTRIPTEIHLESSELNGSSVDPHGRKWKPISDPLGSVAEEVQVQNPASNRRSLLGRNSKKTPSSRSVQFGNEGQISTHAKRPSSRRELPIGSFHSRGASTTGSGKRSMPIGSFHSRGASTTGSGKRSILSIGKSSAHKTFRTIVNISKYKIKHRQPSKDAIVRMVDYWYAKFDPKTNTVADMYTAIEDHFVMKLSKSNRKVVRQRLVHLSTERALQRQSIQANDTRNKEKDTEMVASGSVSIASFGDGSSDQDDHIFKSSLEGSSLEPGYAHAPTNTRKKKKPILAATEKQTKKPNLVQEIPVAAEPLHGKKATTLKKPNAPPKQNSASRKTKSSGGKGVEAVVDPDPRKIAESQDEEIVFGEATDHENEADRAVEQEEGRPLVREPTIPNRRGAELQSAVFAFDAIRYTVGRRGDGDEIHILRNISGKIKCGRKFHIRLVLSCLVVDSLGSVA
jgi:hypothetical protein